MLNKQGYLTAKQKPGSKFEGFHTRFESPQPHKRRWQKIYQISSDHPNLTQFVPGKVSSQTMHMRS